MDEQTTPQPQYGASWQDIISAGEAPEPVTAEPVTPAPPGQGADAATEEEEAPRTGRALARAAGLGVAGLIMGVIGVTAVQAAVGGSPSTTGTAATSQVSGNGTLPGQGGGPPRGFGGVAGEQRVAGTVTAVGSSSITVRSTSGKATYAVNGTTQIQRNGQQAALSSLQTGDQVLVHLVPSGSGYIAERVLVGAFGGPGGPGGTPASPAPGRTT
jgi:hypothetical protein